VSAHGFYSRTLVDAAFDGTIRVRRYFCGCCKRTVSLLPQFALPYLRFGVGVISLFLIARLLGGRTLVAAAAAAMLPADAITNCPARRKRRFLRQSLRTPDVSAVSNGPDPATLDLSGLDRNSYSRGHRFHHGCTSLQCASLSPRAPQVRRGCSARRGLRGHTGSSPFCTSSPRPCSSS